MKKIKTLLIICFASISFIDTAVSQPQFQNFISYVNSISDVTLKNSKIDSFMNYHSAIRIPVIEDNFAIFIFRGSVNSVSVASDFNSWSAASAMMTNAAQTNFFYFTKSFELNARLDYKFVLNGSNWILDPFNPKTCTGGFGPNSELAMTNYIQPLEINYNSSIPHGTIQVKEIFSVNTASLFQLKIYLPPNYNPNDTTRYPAIYFQDGFEYIDLAFAVNVLDNLIAANKISSSIAVFVKPNNRNEEYAGSKRNQYANFFAVELVPFIDSLYKTIRSHQKRLTLGDSFGGNISALICYNYPNVFGNCGLHSGAFQSNGYEVYNLFVNNPKKEIKFASVWGTYESLWTNMRNFRDNLISKGYQIKTLELPEGHSWGLWRANIDFILEYIFPFSSLKNDESKIELKNFNLMQNYPNPFSSKSISGEIGSTRISYSLNSRQNISLKIFDVLGKEIAELVNEEKEAGVYSFDFSPLKIELSTASNLSSRIKFTSGVYFYQLKAGNIIQTKKMLYLR